jgi:hypothetical protein
MNLRFLTALLGVLGLAVVLLSGPAARSQDGADSNDGIFDQVALLRQDDAAKPDEGVQPVGKGPVHEAFAEPVSNAVPQPSPIVPKQPPALIEELPPQEKPEGDNVQWVSGYWAWDEDGQDFLWVSGIWRNIPPGRQWVPGHFKQVANGWQWVNGFWTTAQQGDINVVPLPPPEPIHEAEPPRPSENATYVPGNWVYHETRYLWRPGFWCAYRPGWVWVPAHYVWTPCGFVFVEGYWDFPLQERGLLFAPCRFDPRVAFAVGFRFTPRFVVNDHCLMGSLFLRPRHGCYFFGDFFDLRYQRAGFVSWTEFRIGRIGCDPLFSYYRIHHSHDPRWERDLHELYHARRLGTVARPPVTLVQQETIINNIRVDKTINVKNVNNVAMLAPVSKVNQKVVKLEQLDNTKRQEAKKHGDELRELSKQRAKQENVLLASRDTTSGKKDGTVKNLKLNLPTQPELKDKDKGELGKKKTPPPPPILSKPGDRVLDKKGDDKKDDKKLDKLPDSKKPDDKPKIPEIKKPADKKDDKKPDDKPKLPEIKKPVDKKDDKKPDDKVKIPEIKKPVDKKDDKKPEFKKPEKPPEIKKEQPVEIKREKPVEIKREKPPEIKKSSGSSKPVETFRSNSSKPKDSGKSSDKGSKDKKNK